MATLVSTGQITIVDQNDARSITAVLVSNSGIQQVYTKDEATLSYNPSWFTSNMTLTPQISVGGLTANQAWAALSNKQFSLSAGGTALTTASTSTSFVDNSDVVVSAPFTVTHAAAGSTTPSTFVVKANLLASVGVFTIYFDADFNDPVTGLTTHICCQATLGSIKTGTNAVFINIRGNNTIEEATGQTKNNVALSADLVRAGGIDTSGLTYKWYDSTGTQISTSTSGYATKFGFKTVASPTIPTASGSDLGVNVPASGAGNAYNTIVINETAVVDIAIFRVDIVDSDSKTYSQYFTIYDISDPYDIQVISSTGDKLQNGQGSTVLTPRVFYSATEVTNLTGWSFTWYFYDRNGKRGAFVDTSKISTAGGATISANTTGTGATFTYSGTSYAFAAGDIVKCVKPDGSAFFYEVASSTTNVVTIRTPSTNTWLTFTDYPAPTASTDFVNGKLFGCTTGGTRTTSGASTVTLTGDEVDVKARVLVEANRP